MGTEIQPTFDINGTSIPRDLEGRYSLTELWKAAGKPKGKNPSEWLPNASTKEFIASLAAKSKTEISVLLSVIVGNVKGRGIWGHWQIALAYAKWVSPEFHQHVNEGYRRWQEEEKNPALGAERAAKNYLKQGFTAQWVSERLPGIVTRKELTSTMKDHNCKPNARENPYAEATRTISLSVLGKTPREIRDENHLTKQSQRTRDYLDEYELVRLRFAESEAKKLIQETAADGNEPCVECARKAGQAVKIAIESLATKKKATGS